jgi:ubiquinone/menaquinone biosynthesis C-methylase UbiE
MKLLRNLIKIVNKSTLLEKITFILLIFLIATILHNIKNRKEGFNDKLNIINKTDINLFDEFYVNIYDTLVYNKIKNNFELKNILGVKPSNNKYNVLDIGCGTGHHVNLLNKSSKSNNTEVIGIDKSTAMIKKAKENYPKYNFKVCNALDSMIFEPNTFTHITCLYFTIYYIKDKKQLFENCYKWLIPNGKLILHLVNTNNFDYVNSVSTPLDTNKRITKNTVNFNDMYYKSEFKLNKNIDNTTASLQQSNAMFKEKIKLKDSNNVRINEHKLYMPIQKSILSLAKDTGFTLKSQVEMESINFKNNFLYTLVK